MISSEAKMMIKLENTRIKSTFLIMVAALVLVTGAVRLDVVKTFFSGFYFILPFIAGVLFSAGIISDDLQQRTMPVILSLPLSRSRLWTLRFTHRLALFLTYFLLWYVIPVLFSIRMEWVVSFETTSPAFIVAAGFTAFASGLFFSNFMRNTFESAIAAGIGNLFILILLKTTMNGNLIIPVAVALIIVVSAARNLFLCREPLEFSALVSRAAFWILILVSALIPVTLIF